VWIGNNIARVLALEPGDTIELSAFGQVHRAEVLGVVSHVAGSPVFVPRALMEGWVPGGAFPVNIVLIRTDDTAAVRDRISTMEGVVAVEVFANFKRDLDNYLMFFRVGTYIYLGFSLLLTLGVLFNTVNASLREQREEMSILRALGTRGGEIALMVMVELLLVVSAGMLIGIPLGRETGFYLFAQYNTDTYGGLPQMTWLSYLAGGGALVLIVVVATLPGLRAVQRVDLGQVSKSQSI
jgi:ABC-type antimicrobial peptide transport system permease subunit